MLKKIMISAIWFVLIFTNICATICYAQNITLDQIVTKFNNSKIVKEYVGNDATWVATSNGNKLTIDVTTPEENYKFEYNLEGTISTINFSKEEAFLGAFVTMVLIDCIGQLHGYAEEELMDNFNSGDVTNYTIENEGLEIKKFEDGSGQIKVDIAKKIPLADLSNTYITISDLEDLKQWLTGNGIAQKSVGNVIFNKNGDGENAVVFVAEKKELTENTYRSILSILEVMFQTKKAANYFESNYPNVSFGNKQFSGFKVEVNPEKSSIEQNVLGDDKTYQFIRLTIDKRLVNNAIQNEVTNGNNNSSNNNNTYQKDSSQSSKILPKTGSNFIICLSIAIIIIAVIVISIKIYQYKDVK